MRILLCLLFSLCFTHEMLAQSDTIDKKYAATISAVIFPYRLGIQPGFQVKIGNRFALMSDFGFATSGKGNNQYDKMRFFKLASELKYYSKPSVNGNYFSFQAGYVQRKFEAKDSGWFWREGGSDASGYSSARINSPVLLTAIKVGRERRFREKIFADIFLGIGARYIRTRYEVKDVHSIHLGGARDSLFEILGFSWEHEGDQVKLHATAGLRAGIRF